MFTELREKPGKQIPYYMMANNPTFNPLYPMAAPGGGAVGFGHFNSAKDIVGLVCTKLPGLQPMMGDLSASVKGGRESGCGGNQSLGV